MDLFSLDLVDQKFQILLIQIKILKLGKGLSLLMVMMLRLSQLDT